MVKIRELLMALGALALLTACQPAAEPASVPLAASPASQLNEPEAGPTPVETSRNGRIAFYSSRDGNPEIYMIDPDGSRLVRLTNDAAFDDSPAISPDGTQVAFLTARHDPNPQYPLLKYEIYLVNSDGTNLRRLTATEAAEDHPAWSPGGAKIIFDADYDGDGFYEIYTIDLGGSNLTRLTSNPANDQFADWSPDGDQIAFSSDRSGNWDIYLMDADGSNQRQLTDSPDWELFPAWSPDGMQIAFNGLKPDSRNTDVYLMDRDGSHVRQLTDAPGFDENPAWSPDGSQIAFQTRRDGNFEIYVMNRDGSDQRPLGTGPADDLWPSWGPETAPTSGFLPSLQPITPENANRLRLLHTLEIPGYARAQVSQCSLAFSPDGSSLAGACGKNAVPVWDVLSGQLRHSLYAQPEHIVACAFSRGGEALACGGFDKSISLWNPETGEEIAALNSPESPVWDIDFGPEGAGLASCSLGMAGGDPRSGNIYLWNPPDGEPAWGYSGKRDYLSISFSPSGKNIAYGAMGGSVGVLDAASGELVREMTDSTRNIGDLAYSPSGRWLAAGSDDNRIYLWDASTYDLAAQLSGHGGYVNGVAFNPDETLLASGSHDKTVGVWDLSKQKRILSLDGHEEPVLRVAFNPAGTLIASISWDGTVRLWGVTGEQAMAFSLEKSDQEFTSPETFQAALGDLDGDGDLDAVFANPQRNSSQVWLNDGGGAFVDTGQQLTQFGHGAGLADFDEDGDLDAFIACHQFLTPSKIYLNDGSGNLQDTGQDLGDRNISAGEVNLLDLNGDGHIDVHVLYYDPNGLPDKVYLNDGHGVFADSGLELNEETIAWGDLDGDGDADYFGKVWGKGYVVQLNQGGAQGGTPGGFSVGWQMDDSRSTVGGVALADFDGDGDLDALVANGFRETGGQPGLLLWNNGDGSFTDSGEILNETLGSELAVGDLDLDGDPDVFVANMDRPNEVWLNESGGLVDSGLRLGEGSDLSGKASLGDLDGDGDLDVVVGRFNGGAEVWFNTGHEGE